MRNPVVVPVIDKWLNIFYISYMRVFSISYGIKTETEIEKWLRFLRKIKHEYDWHHPIETVWFVKSDKSAEDIYHDLYEPGTFNGFIVTEIKPECIEGWASNQFWLWLKDKKGECVNES